MRKFLLATALAAAISTPAAAKLELIGRYGGWGVLAGTNQQGVRLCSVATTGQIGGRHSLFALKYFDGQGFFTLQVGKEGWRVPAGAQVPLNLTIDGKAFALVASPGEGGDHLMVAMPQQQFFEFAQAFRLGRQMAVDFPSGTEGGWVAILRGSAAAMDAFFACIVALDRPAPTQPFVAPTQPFVPQ